VGVFVIGSSIFFLSFFCSLPCLGGKKKRGGKKNHGKEDTIMPCQRGWKKTHEKEDTIMPCQGHVKTDPDASSITLPITYCSTHYILWSLLLVSTWIYVPFPDWTSTSGYPGAPAPAHLYHVSCLSLLSWLSLICLSHLGRLCPFIGLVYVLLLRSRRGLSPKAHCQKSISFYNCDVHCLEDTGVT